MSDATPDVQADPAPDEAATGLPWPTTWPGVYRLVLAGFLVQVALLLLLRVSTS